MTTMNIGLDSTQRHDNAEGLARLLADTATLYFKTHSFHWNVTGPWFRTLHLMFEEQYNELWTAMDDIAERSRALGVHAAMSWADIARHASIAEATEVPAAEDMVRQLVTGHETLIRTARSLLPTAGDAGDEVTAGLLTDRLTVHEKTAWMLRSLLA